jgi:chromosome partitioning protein
MRVLAVYSIKGGVGKTTAAANLSHLAARNGRRTLLWDLDPQGSATFLFRVRPKVKGGADGLVRRKVTVGEAVKETDFPGLDILPADFSNRNLDLVLDHTRHPVQRLARVLAPVAREYEVVVLDCAPSVSLASEAVLRAADVLAVPVVPSPLALRTYGQLEVFLARQSRPPALVPFFSMVDRRRRAHRELLEADPPDGRGNPWVAVPASAQVERMGHSRAPLGSFAPRCAAARSFEELWSAVEGVLFKTAAVGAP